MVELQVAKGNFQCSGVMPILRVNLSKHSYYSMSINGGEDHEAKKKKRKRKNKERKKRKGKERGKR